MTDTVVLHERANEALISGNTEKAVEIYNKIMDINPLDDVALHQLMDIYQDTDRFKYYLARANVNIAQNKLDHAISDTKKAINLETESLDANVKLARLYRVAKKGLKAIDQFNRVLELDNKNADAYLELINLYTEEDSLQSAITTAMRAVDAFGENPYFRNILAKLYLDDGNYDKALDVVEDTMLEAKILLQKGDNDAAKERIDKINPNKLDKDQKPNYYILLAQYYYNKKMSNEANDAIDKYVASKEPDAVSFQMRALVCEDNDDAFGAALNWGFCNKVRGKYEEAIMHFMEAHNLDSANKDAIHELINLYQLMGDKFVAAEYWQKLYELDGDEEARQALADFYYSQGDVALARKYGKELSSKSEEGSDNSAGQPPIEEDEGLLNKIMRMFGK